MELEFKSQIGAPIALMSVVVPSLESLAAEPLKKSNILTEDIDSSKKNTNHNNSLNDLSPSLKPEHVDDKPNIPDGGWGWVVVFATFVLCMVADGVTFSFGLLYGQFLTEFEASNSTTSWIGSLFMAIPLLTGPVMSALVDKFGCRSMTIVGGVISASGFILSSKCYSLSLMYLTFGTLAGLGLGLIYVTVVVSVAFWFDKRRTLAVGIGSSGIGIGTLVFSPLTTYLITEYGWRGTTLILGGCFLNMCVCGALMRDPDWITVQNMQNSKSKTDKSLKSSTASLTVSTKNFLNEVNIEELKALLATKDNVKEVIQELKIPVDNDDDENKLKRYFYSVLNLPTFLKEYEKVSWSKPQETATHESRIIRQNSYHEKYFMNLKVNKQSLIHKGALFNTNKYRFKTSSCPNIYRVSMVSLPKQHEEKWYSEIVDVVKDMFDYSLFLELHFFLLSLSTITLFTWFIVPYFYLAELMSQSGYSREQTAFTISNMGISNTIGMIFLGWAGDRPWMNITKTYAMFLVLCGISIAGQMFFVNNFILLQIWASLFGISLSSHFAFTPGIVMELVPMDRFTIAYGLQLLCQGTGTLVGPPYAGFLFDITQSWEQSFYQAGIWIVLSGIFVGIIPYIKNRKMFGKGSVEKGAEESNNQLLPLVILSIFMVISFVLVFYLTGKSVCYGIYGTIRATENNLS